MRTELTPNAQRVLDYLRTTPSRRPPTRAEIAKATGIASTGTVQRALELLAEFDLITLEAQSSRGIFLNENSDQGRT